MTYCAHIVPEKYPRKTIACYKEQASHEFYVKIFTPFSAYISKVKVWLDFTAGIFIALL